MLVLINGKKPPNNIPTKENQPHLADVISSFNDRWKRFKRNRTKGIGVKIKQLQIVIKQNEA